MPPNPSIEIPTSYETLPTTHIKLSHHPAGSASATPVVIITLNRPEKRNAFTPQMADGLERVFATLDLDERVKSVVLTGAGSTFCAGADLEIGFRGGPERAGDHRDRYPGLHPPRLAMNDNQSHLVAVELPWLFTDVANPPSPRYKGRPIAHEKSKYGFVFARRGITMESCSSYFLPRLIGYSRALYLVSTGGVFPAISPHFDGLFAETLPEQAQILPRALELAAEIAQNVSPMASALNRALLWRGSESAEEAHLLESSIISQVFGSKYISRSISPGSTCAETDALSRDQLEGVKAFFEKRNPDFTATLEEHGPANYPWWHEVNIHTKPKAVKETSKL
ncbi:enoyl-CoA hydratase/isomerase family protein [Aspergillus affinis]|uniref:enoyl-CoA hydratase/isomerase family protein n=1 Tax=Aspergillus affinis TaxID=1070780 RepID=UPI0022FE7611|nr:enoyl-CoA hydratase/isomerase family protein [Aspergillus affinis]KAI9038328.1 enoyl-CoA hydratase/isomerase family protein [Aspergillus affinis]